MLEISEETIEGLEVHVYCTIRLANSKALISFKVLRLCFRICKMLFFSRRGLYMFRFIICCMYMYMCKLYICHFLSKHVFYLMFINKSP